MSLCILFDDDAVCGLDDRPTDENGASVEIDVTPAKPAHFATTCPRCRRQVEEARQIRIDLAGYFEEVQYRLRVEGR
jgi:hypothetical protein